ncbi:MAG: TylF/MycF/NovP-related O-methyltransferase [Candidatus Riflebacteria bacterium]
MFRKLKEIWRESVDFANLRMEIQNIIGADDLNRLLQQFNLISKSVECPHNPSHILTFVLAMLKTSSLGEGCFVEAGCFKGGSTAKLSLIARRLKKRLIVFDSFEGLPPNQEAHQQTIHGQSIEGWFKEKEFCGGLEEVKNNVTRFGDIDSCEFIKGWFENTLPDFNQPVLAAYIDVDLASSTRTCIKNLFPKMVKGGHLVSQDGDFPLVIEALEDKNFWLQEVGCPMPEIQGLRQKKMLTILKP